MKNIAIVIFLLLLTACGTMHQVPERNAEIFPWETKYKIDPENISSFTPYNSLENVDFILLKTETNFERDKYLDFMKMSLGLIGFDNVLTEEDLTKLIIRKNLADKISSTSDLLSLYNARKELGAFLVFHCELKHLYECWWETYVKIINPENIATLLEARKKAIAWVNVDKEFNYPTLNLIHEWKISSQ